MPMDLLYLCVRPSRAVSQSFSTTSAGEGSEGLPMPRSITSTSCWRLASSMALSRPNRYGGRRRIRADTSIFQSSVTLVILSLPGFSGPD